MEPIDYVQKHFDEFADRAPDRKTAAAYHNLGSFMVGLQEPITQLRKVGEITRDPVFSDLADDLARYQESITERMAEKIRSTLENETEIN
ncbi:hypothetical protein VVR12_01680 [Rothia sp. LK2588]|uniref:hypothetical protein n=1 Tax=Rothia sp. LK2588 TaxID=3114369 RepID=UPI0034CD0404